MTAFSRLLVRSPTPTFTSPAEKRPVIQALLQFVGIAVLSLVVPVIRTHLSRRRRAEVQTGGTASCRAVLSVDDGKFRRGVLLLSPTRATWQSKHGNRALDLGGARVITAGPAQQRQARPDDVLLRLVLPGGASTRILLHESDAATFLEVLGRTEAPSASAVECSPTPTGRARWALPSFVLAALWVVVWAALALDGATVTVTVASVTPDGLCVVTWIGSDGSHHSGDLDCDNPVVGSRETAWALGWPVTADVEKPASMVPGVLVTGALLACPGAVSLIRRRRRLRRPVPTALDAPGGRTPPRVRVPDQDAPPLSVDDARPWHGEPALSYLNRLAPYASRQLALDGWENPGLPAGADSPQLAGTVLRALGVPAMLLVAVIGLVWVYSGNWFVLSTAATTTTVVGTSTGESASGSHWPLPEMVTVSFRTSDRIEHLADVSTLDSLPAGTPVTVEYALADPDAARLVGPADGLGRGVALTLGALAVLAAWSVRRGRAARAGVRAVHAATEQPPNPAVGLLTADPAGRPLLLACNPLVQPVQLYAVPLEPPLPHGTAATFAASGATELRLRGRLWAGELVVPEAGGRRLRPSGPATLPDDEQLARLLDSVGALVRAADGDEHRGQPGDEGYGDH